MKDNLIAFTRAAPAHLAADDGLFQLDGERTLVGRIAGAGYRALLAAACERFDTLGDDLVARLTNSMIAHVAEPLYVQARIAGTNVDPDVVVRLMNDFHAACRANGCALLGAEFEDVAGLYASARFDVTASVVARLDLSTVLDVDTVRAGDAIVGLPDPSVNARGCALALEHAPDAALLDAQPPYGDVVAAIRKAAPVRSMAHVERSLFDDVPRALPASVAAVFEPARWDVPAPLAALVDRAGLDHDARFRVLGMGIGFMLIVPLAHVEQALAAAQSARVVGFVQPRRDDGPAVVVRAPRPARV